MGYRSQVRSLRNAGRGHERMQRKKAKAKRQKRRFSQRDLLEEEHVPTSGEVVEKTLLRLRSLGNQIFGLFPFSEYFDDWLISLKDVLSGLESSSAISVDDQFMEERSQIVSDVERELGEWRQKEVIHDAALKSLSDDKILLERIDEEYATRIREFEGKKNSEIKRLSRNAQSLKEELDRITKMKAGIFRSISKKEKALKEIEANQRLEAAQSELQLAVQNFNVQQEKLQSEHEKRKQLVIEQMQNLRKEIENLEIDGSLEARRAACEALVNAVNGLLQRKSSSLH
jgi:DNA segregation ATPase FtsK/SpoIIIE-like protein